VALPSIDAFGNGSPVVEVARAAEHVGLAHVWVPDHLIFHHPILEATTALAVAAGATARIRLGTAILNPTLRSVTWLAKQLATLAMLAPERLLLGLGLGGEYEPEFRAAGVDPKQRGKRLDEALTLLPRLLSGGKVKPHGLDEVDCQGLAPVPFGLPPVLVGGRLAIYRDVGVDGFCLPPAHPRPVEQIDHLADLRQMPGHVDVPA
jgi:alkanesulfonate monooxygenase SsuD/methylene tetrahydromethanopterin reductase-like flavin-dependent oxidoreductase (luciferase family)